MALRNLLAMSRVDEFKEWLEDRGWIEADLVSRQEFYFVRLKMLHPTIKGAVVIYKHGEAGIHASVPDGLAAGLLRQWLAERKR